MKALKYFAVVAVTAVICIAGMRWHYTSRIISRAKEKTPDITKTNYYRMKQSMFNNTNENEGRIVFLGDSLTDWLKLDELLPEVNALNRGIAGDTTRGVLHRVGNVIKHKPAKLFLLIGVNDVWQGISPEKIADNIRKIIRKFREGSPDTKIYLQTLLPVNSAMLKMSNDKINAVNVLLKTIATETGCELVDLNALFSEDGELPSRYTYDGLHINGEAAQKWIDHIKPLI